MLRLRESQDRRYPRRRHVLPRALLALAVAWTTLGPGTRGVARAEGPNAIVTLPTATSPDACRETVLPRNDDGSTGLVTLPFTLNFFGVEYGALYVNNNGNVTFDFPLGTYTPFPLQSTSRSMIAPFFADVDTGGIGSDVVTYSFGAGTFGDRPTFCVNWVNVGYYAANFDKLNSAQLLLVDRSDVGPGDFDIVMNYDKVQWETGDASGGSGGLGGVSARVGYSNGVSQSFELPGSSVNGAFLDSNPASGLIWNSRNSVQPGRYIFPVRNGAPPIGGTISGRVYRESALPANSVSGAFVQVCGTQGACNVTTTNAVGRYSVAGLPADSYTVRAFPPGSSPLEPATLGPIEITGSETISDADLVLLGPPSLPGNVTITNRYITADGLPVLYWNDPLTLTATGCPGGSASYTMTLGGTVIRSGAMTEDPAGTYTATIAPLIPNSGIARVSITIECPGGGTEDFVFDVYIDPSGTVRTLTGAPVVGATVTLLRSDAESGPFEVVPDGSGVMSLANRRNPDATDARGHFGWDVIAGFYKVRAERTGCTNPTDPALSFVETAVLTIPPPVTDLDLRLDCPVDGPNPDEARCEASTLKAVSTLARTTSTCQQRCLAGARKTMGGYDACFPPFGDAKTLSCLADPKKGARSKAVSTIGKGCARDCPECYPAEACTTGEPFVEDWATQLDPLRTMIWCVESAGGTPTQAEAKCEDGIVRALVKFTASKVRCYAKCRQNELKGKALEGSCAAPSPADPATAACLFHATKGAEAKAAAAIDNICQPSTTPACHAGRDGGSWVTAAEADIDGNLPAITCGG
jgi:hypothetical protein